MMCNYFRFGGVARDLPEGITEKIRELVFERLPRKIDELDLFLTNNEIIRARAEGVGVLTPEEAIAYSACRPGAARFGRALRYPPRRSLQHLRPLRFRCGGALPRRHL